MVESDRLLLGCVSYLGFKMWAIEHATMIRLIGRVLLAALLLRPVWLIAMLEHVTLPDCSRSLKR